MKELLENIAKALVDDPDEMKVNEIAGSRTKLYELRVAKEDMGKIIGKGGETVMAIRTILNGVASKLKVRAVLEILEFD
jgi:hypothetical protein